jgi:hypothetical protein
LHRLQFFVEDDLTLLFDGYDAVPMLSLLHHYLEKFSFLANTVGEEFVLWRAIKWIAAFLFVQTIVGRESKITRTYNTHTYTHVDTCVGIHK